MNTLIKSLIKRCKTFEHDPTTTSPLSGVNKMRKIVHNINTKEFQAILMRLTSISPVSTIIFYKFKQNS